MASVEALKSSYRVVWRQGGVKQTERFATETDAARFAALVEAQDGRWPRGWIKGHGFTDEQTSAPTFAEWATRAIAARSTANDKTRADYTRTIDKHLAPKFGGTPVDQITREHVGAWVIAMRDTVKPKTLKNVQALASSIMADAIAHGYATRNPFRGALRSLPTVKQEEMVFLSRGEFDTLLRHVPEPHHPLLLCLAHTGARWSEVTALQVHDVDVLARRLRIVRAWKLDDDYRLYLGEPKTRRSRRTLVISTQLVDALLPLVAGRDPSEFLFTTATGRPVRSNNFRQRVWRKAVTAAQRCDTHADAEAPCGCAGTLTKAPRIHDLRHSHASWLIADKVSLPAIQRRLGHESITTTIDRYGHLSPDVDDEILSALDSWAVSAGPARVLDS